MDEIKDQFTQKESAEEKKKENYNFMERSRNQKYSTITTKYMYEDRYQ